MPTMGHRFVEKSQETTSPKLQAPPSAVEDLFQWLSDNALTVENLPAPPEQSHQRISIITFEDGSQATVLSKPRDDRIFLAEGSHLQPLANRRTATVQRDGQAAYAYFSHMEAIQANGHTP